MIKAQTFQIDDISVSHSKYSHYCVETLGNIKCWLRDDFNMKNIGQQDISVFHKIDHSTLPGAPFGQAKHIASKCFNTYTLLINGQLFSLEEITLSSEQRTENSIIHYIISPHDLRTHSSEAEHEAIRKKLTTKETNVLVLLSKGHSMSRIAKQLNLSPHTVDSHRLNLCKKLNVKRTTQLAVWAYKLGLLEDV